MHATNQMIQSFHNMLLPILIKKYHNNNFIFIMIINIKNLSIFTALILFIILFCFKFYNNYSINQYFNIYMYIYLYINYKVINFKDLYFEKKKNK